MINPDYKTLSGLYSIEHYCGKGYPHDRKSLHLHTFDEISLIENGEITYISDTVSDKVSGKSLIYSKAYHLHNPYINPDKLYSRYQISVNSRTVMKSIAELSEINMPSFILKLSDSEYSDIKSLVQGACIYSRKHASRYYSFKNTCYECPLFQDRGYIQKFPPFSNKNQRLIYFRGYGLYRKRVCGQTQSR